MIYWLNYNIFSYDVYLIYELGLQKREIVQQF
jgi:hypothetical protein